MCLLWEREASEKNSHVTRAHKDRTQQTASVSVSVWESRKIKNAANVFHLARCLCFVRSGISSFDPHRSTLTKSDHHRKPIVCCVCAALCSRRAKTFPSQLYLTLTEVPIVTSAQIPLMHRSFELRAELTFVSEWKIVFQLLGCRRLLTRESDSFCPFPAGSRAISRWHRLRAAREPN